MENRAAPAVEPAAKARPALPRVRPVGLAAPLHWLARGARDLAAFPGVAAFYGLCD